MHKANRRSILHSHTPIDACNINLNTSLLTATLTTTQTHNLSAFYIQTKLRVGYRILYTGYRISVVVDSLSSCFKIY
jgi:hypothetical protein